MEDELLARARKRIGTTLRGKYRIDRILGIGGMGIVYAATHRNRSRVAVKVLHLELSIEGGFRERFLREGYLANTVEHPGAVRVIDDDVSEDGAVFLVMELLEGETLETRWQRRGKKLDPEEVTAHMRALLDVLAAAHAKGIVHRDIKPENIFLTIDGRIKVLDFGVARLRDASPTATRSGLVVGTPAFMPPEQVLGHTQEIDALTDIWAVGATAFTLITGRIVHEGTTSQEIMVSAATKVAAPIASVVTDIRPELAMVIDQALAFQKADRWPSARAMREALPVPEDQTIVGVPPTHEEWDEKTKVDPLPNVLIDSAVEPATAEHTLQIGPRAVATIVGWYAHWRRPRYRYALVAAGGLIGGMTAALAIVGTVVALGGSKRAASRALASASASESSAPVAVTRPARAVAVEDASAPLIEAAPSAPAPSAPSASVADSIAPAPSLAPARVWSPPRPTPSAALPEPPKDECDPPYVIGVTGIKHWKKGCN